MTSTLQDIADYLKDRIARETNSGKVEVFSVILNLVEVLQGQGTPVDDKAQMQSKIDHLNSLLDNDAKIFLAIKTALGNPNLTQGEIANEITTKWRRI